MPETDRPQIYLITPPEVDLAAFPDRLAAILDAHEVACVRLALATRDEDRLGRAADTLREVAHGRDVAVVIEAHVRMVERHGLDGVHLTDAARSVRKVRADLGADAILGTFCAGSRHDGMTAAEIGADYVSFGPVGRTALGTGEPAPFALFEWWSEMIEVPVVAEGALDEEIVRRLAPVVDFLGIGEEVWCEDDPAAALGRLIAAAGQG
jgi:thiamine-phosphate pyrophosphorylase